MATLTKTRGRSPIAEGSMTMSWLDGDRFCVGLWDNATSKMFNMTLSRAEAQRFADWVNAPHPSRPI